MRCASDATSHEFGHVGARTRSAAPPECPGPLPGRYGGARVAPRRQWLSPRRLWLVPNRPCGGNASGPFSQNARSVGSCAAGAHAYVVGQQAKQVACQSGMLNPTSTCRCTGVLWDTNIAKASRMNDRIASTPEVAPSPATTVVARSYVNSAMRQTYVPSNTAPARPGSDDHKRYASKGNPT